MRKILIAIMMLGVLSACSKSAPPPIPKEQLVDPVFIQFLSACSGVTITDGTSQAVAYGTCVGYTRGFADGHQATIDGIQRSTSSLNNARLWCIPPNTKNSTVMETVVTWIVQNQVEYERLMSQFSGINAATAVIVTALNKAPGFSPEKCK